MSESRHFIEVFKKIQVIHQTPLVRSTTPRVLYSIPNNPVRHDQGLRMEEISYTGVYIRRDMFKRLFAFAAKSGPVADEQDIGERSLIRAAQQGDHSAFRMLYDSYHGQLYNLTYYTLKDSQLAEDTLQSIFLKIYRGLPGYRFESSFKTWAFRIAVNEAKNQLRSKKSDLPLTVISGTSQEMHEAPGPHEEQLMRQREAVVKRALMELSPKMRTVIVLKYVDGLSYEEIATVLDCSAGTVASRLNRALEKLEALLAPFKSVL